MNDYSPEEKIIIRDKQTIEYYNQNASTYTMDTSYVDFENVRKRFTDKLFPGAYILDFGCGSGRDTKAFLEQGFRVDAIDGSERMCEIASEYTGISVTHLYFQDFEETDKYDGIWACASILHLTRNELVNVLKCMARSLKDHGIIYTSFKYGTFEGKRNGRYFTNMTEVTFSELIEQIPEFKVDDEWISQDVRKEREKGKWLNLLIRKI